MDTLFDLLIEYYKSRAEYHIDEFLMASKDQHESPPETSRLGRKRIAELSSFRSLAERSGDEGHSVSKIKSLAKVAHRLVRSLDIEASLQKVFKAGAATRVFKQLRFIARIQTIYLSILDCIRAFPNFGKIEIVMIPHAFPTCVLPGSLVAAREAALATLQEYLGYVPRWINNPRTAAAIRAAFYGHQLIVHAEMQTVCFFEKHKDYKPFPYLGVSKKSCYLCALFLSEQGTYKTRGSHGQLHPYWTLPRDFAMRKRRMFDSSPAATVHALKQRLVERFGKAKTGRLALMAESTAVWSSRMTVSSGVASAASFEHSQLGAIAPSRRQTALSAQTPERIRRSPAPARFSFSQRHPEHKPTVSTNDREAFILKLEVMLRLLQVSSAFGICTIAISVIADFLQVQDTNLPEEIQRALTLLRLQVQALLSRVC